MPATKAAFDINSETMASDPGADFSSVIRAWKNWHSINPNENSSLIPVVNALTYALRYSGQSIRFGLLVRRLHGVSGHIVMSMS
jgi:hypothetical protein